MLKLTNPTNAAKSSLSNEIQSEALLLPRIAGSSDNLAVEDFINKYGGLIWHLAKCHTKTKADAEDAVQAIFLDLWRNAALFDSEKSSEIIFVAMIARRRLIEILARKNSFSEDENLEVDETI